MEKRVLTPPEIVDVPGKTIFLAGPIQGARDWQSEAIDIIHHWDDSVIIRSPRKDYAPGEFVYEKQVDWETHNLRQAAKYGVILFWLAKQTEETPKESGDAPVRSYAQTTRLELGEWATRRQYEPVDIALGIESGFTNERYIRRRFSQDNPDVTIESNLAETCLIALGLLNNH